VTSERAATGREDFEAFYRAHVAELVALAAAEGGVRADIHPGLTSRLLFGTVNSLAEWLRPTTGHSPAELADAVAKVAFDGLRTTNR